MATISRFEEIEAWQTARELTRQIYTLTGSGQFARDFGLSDKCSRQISRFMQYLASQPKTIREDAADYSV
jgi:hypothetical protein